VAMSKALRPDLTAVPLAASARFHRTPLFTVGSAALAVPTEEVIVASNILSDAISTARRYYEQRSQLPRDGFPLAVLSRLTEGQITNLSPDEVDLRWKLEPRPR